VAKNLDRARAVPLGKSVGYGPGRKRNRISLSLEELKTLNASIEKLRKLRRRQDKADMFSRSLQLKTVKEGSVPLLGGGVNALDILEGVIQSGEGIGGLFRTLQ